MATIINLPPQIKSKLALHKEITKKYDMPGRNPEKALDGMYGLWENQNISIENIREAKRN